jgi:opacity protein-like surface antigen
MKRVLLATVFAAICAPAVAADLPAKAVQPRDLPVVACTVTMCTGFYFGGHVEGSGDNADILGSGINGSVFANGAGLGAHAGYQVWNGNFFGAFEVGGTYYTGTVPNLDPTFTDQRWAVDYLFKGGIGLQGLFNSAPAQSQGPVSIFQNLNAALISPYFLVGGRTRSFGSGLATGAGAQYTLGGGWNAFAEYEHVNYNQSVGNGSAIGLASTSGITENIVRGGINRMF